MKIKIDKNLIATYLSLDSKKADEYLSNLANQIKTEIIASSDNDEILEYLILLEGLVYKVPQITMEIVRHITEGVSKPTKIHKAPFGEFEGKAHNDLVLKSIELLSHIRYIAPDEVLKLAARLSHWEDSEVKNKVLGVVKNFAKYDYNILTKSKIGYGAQRKALEFIQAWTPQQLLENFDFVETITKELLSSSIEGSEWTAMDKLTFHSAAVQPTDFLKKLRRETIDLIYNLYNQVDESKKLRLTQVLEEVTQTPSNVAYGDDLTKMILSDIQYLLGVYRKILFNEKNQLIGSIAVAEKIEQRLYWFHRNKGLAQKETKRLRDDILSDKFYSLFRLFAGDDIVFREEAGWEKGPAKRDKAIEIKVREVSEGNINTWIELLNKVAAQAGLVPEWQFSHFRDFLYKFTQKKPKIAERILKDALQSQKPLGGFAVNVLVGLRSTNLDLWDELVKIILAQKDLAAVRAVVASLNPYGDVDLGKVIRKEDLTLLKEITERQKRFAFLVKTKEKDLALEPILINTLLRNFKRDQKLVELLLVETIKRSPKLKNYLIHELQFDIHRGYVDPASFSPSFLKFVKSILVGISDLDWDAQIVLLRLGEKDIGIVFEIFQERIEKDAKRKSMKREIREIGQYTAIPYHFNSDLKQFIAEHPQFKKRFEPLAKKVAPDWSVYNWNIAQFLQEMGPVFAEVIHSIIVKGDDKNLGRAVQLMKRLEGANLELCMEVVGKTDNKDILSQIEALFHATGVVSGEYGIAEAYERKARELEQYKNDKNPRIKRFVVRTVKGLMDSAKRQRQHADEEKQLRRIEFEG